jgi:acyl-CoA synthetase (AMP-forming)/AMP-acid ligase II
VAFNAFPFFWIGGTLILGRSLNHGTAQCCLPRFDPTEALDLIERERCTSITGWPSLVQAMRGDPSFPGRDLSFIPALAPDAPAPIPPGPGGLQGHRSMSELVGNWAGSERKVIDTETGETLDDLEEGELCVRGWGALQGYYKKEREETFDADGWLHTGDRVAMFDNRVFFVGRFYEMIKSGGSNVSPLEVEFTIEQWPEIKHCFVFSTPLPGQVDAQDEEVCAAIVFMPGETMSVDEIQARARGELSSYKVPSRIELIDDEDSLPWLASGKPDKRRLRVRLIAEG